MKASWCMILSTILLFSVGLATQGKPPEAVQQRPALSFSKLPLVFEPNQGQTGSSLTASTSLKLSSDLTPRGWRVSCQGKEEHDARNQE